LWGLLSGRFWLCVFTSPITSLPSRRAFSFRYFVERQSCRQIESPSFLVAGPLSVLPLGATEFREVEEDAFCGGLFPFYALSLRRRKSHPLLLLQNSVFFQRGSLFPSGGLLGIDGPPFFFLLALLPPNKTSAAWCSQHSFRSRPRGWNCCKEGGAPFLIPNTPVSLRLSFLDSPLKLIWRRNCLSF